MQIQTSHHTLKFHRQSLEQLSEDLEHDAKIFLSNENGGKVNVVIKTRNNPGESLSVNSTNSIASTTGQVNLRARTRQAVIRVESDDDDVNGNDSVGWRLGATRLDIKSDGRR